MFLRLTLVFLIIHSTISLSKSEEKKDRVFDRELSDKDHYTNQVHNPEYDHQAFLGEDAKTFDQLPPEESIRRLSLIVDKIDGNNDGFISEEELKDWIKFTQKRYIVEDVDRHWKQHTPEGQNEVSWEDYKKIIYGFLEHMDPAEAQKEDAGMSYHNMMNRDRRRWTAADNNGDDKLNKEEFSAFLHPENTEHMKDIVVLETMEDIDKDKDGKISLEEYIGDMYHGDEGDIEPEWVQNEKLQFSTYRDKDGNGYMDQEEVKNWILPPDFDHAEAEARHLMYEADSDVDQKLTKQEILDKYDLFVGSQATDFGEALARHDEF